LSRGSQLLSTLRRPPWRTVVPLLTLPALLLAGYALWSPGVEVTDGRHDRGHNGLWLQHGWLGDDSWFERNHKKDRIPQFRDSARIAELAQRLREGMEGVRVMPWVGGVLNDHCFPKIPGWRAAFIQSIQELLQAHPRLSGIHLNIEPWPSGDPDLLTLLDELRAALPPGKVLSVAAYPPPTRWHPYAEVHWEQAYFREVARRSDQLAVMMYDTALRGRKLYTWLMSEWTREILDWSGSTPVLLGLPAYHARLNANGLAPNYQGVALYSDWELDESEWRHFREHFLKPTRSP
jgi:hypothetical protein